MRIDEIMFYDINIYQMGLRTLLFYAFNMQFFSSDFE